MTSAFLLSVCLRKGRGWGGAALCAHAAHDARNAGGDSRSKIEDAYDIQQDMRRIQEQHEGKKHKDTAVCAQGKDGKDELRRPVARSVQKGDERKTHDQHEKQGGHAADECEDCKKHAEWVAVRSAGGRFLSARQK